MKVLDHGFVRLVDSMGSDLSIVRSARISYDAEWRSGEDEGKDAKLINYLVKHHHTSPLEAVTFTFDIKAPLFIIAQWHRHRTWAYNQVSARYTELPDEFYIPDLEQITTQSASNKQMRTSEQNPHAADIRKIMWEHNAKAFEVYKDLLAKGTPRELARTVLPTGTYSHMFGTVNLLNLMRFCKLRSHEHAQYEIRVYSDAMLELAEAVCPVTVAAVREHWL